MDLFSGGRPRTEALTHGFEFFGVVGASQLARVPFSPRRSLDTPYGVLVEARSVIVLGVHIWDPLMNAVVVSVIPDGAIPGDHIPDSQEYCFYSELTEARAHRFAKALRNAGNKAVVPHHIHEKAAATMAGLCWIGKQTLGITPQVGPRVRWCTVVTDAVLPYDEPFKVDLCGKCDLCVRACPTNAIIPGPSQGVEPGKKVDFWKCIIPQQYLAEPSEVWRRYAKKYTKRGFTECLICHDACPIGKEEHQRRIKKYATKPPR